MKKTVRLNFEFPREHYPFLKMTCAKQGLSLKDFASGLLIQAIEEYEDSLLTKKAQARLAEIDQNENIDFKEASRLAGWDNAEEIQNPIQQALPERPSKNPKKRASAHPRKRTISRRPSKAKQL